LLLTGYNHVINIVKNQNMVKISENPPLWGQNTSRAYQFQFGHTLDASRASEILWLAEAGCGGEADVGKIRFA
jgi:hypothetical protein